MKLTITTVTLEEVPSPNVLVVVYQGRQIGSFGASPYTHEGDRADKKADGRPYYLSERLETIEPPLYEHIAFINAAIHCWCRQFESFKALKEDTQVQTGQADLKPFWVYPEQHHDSTGFPQIQ